MSTSNRRKQMKWTEKDEQLATRAIQEANVKVLECKPGGEVVYLVSTSGYLRLFKAWNSQLYVVGAGNSLWLQALAGKIATAIGAAN